MNNSSLAQEIIALRKSKRLSQEKLAELASINLRTLQRIEKGETEPRGDTLRLIAAALEVPLENLFYALEKKDAQEKKDPQEQKDVPEKEDLPEKEDKSFLHFLNLSALSFWFIPFGNIFVPMFLWHIKKDQVKNARNLGKRIINFQITWSLAAFLLFCYLIMAKIMHLQLFFPPIVGWLMLPGFYILNTFLILLASYQLNSGREKIFSASLKIVR
ncbi:putative Tic20 family protein [Anseongella ginsenosidimutans]|uniref:Putative Tic20 family protein n=1 Tax=Anseongella ginsenosidimutans TaxID=496056 RepID=A0A4R3KPY6_9SPHI|nr:helix-turn-helix domain-containing protein [Anseongella ginsenosidimutans]QEC52273.1 helix-turn-helix domain-containing protein [Anseongella ginsenosidimutans]TCS86828.1 putative Tic20 family protein [Anseongella ginsenosidimutans]